MARAHSGLRLGLLATMALLGDAASHAADVPLPGKLLLIRDTKVAKVISKATTPFTVPVFGGASDPTVNSSSLTIDDLGGSGILTEVDLASGLWQALGNPPGSRGYLYSNPAAAAGSDPVKRVLVKPQIVKVIAKDDGSLDGPVGGAVEMFLTLGADTYCARFGGNTLKNTTGLVKRKDATAPADCSLPPPPVCGNGIAEAPDEECDDGGTSNGDGCDSNCQLEPTNPALCAGVPTTAGTALTAVLLQGGFTMPTQVAAPRLDPNRIFVVTQQGVIYVIKNGVLLGTPFLDLSDDAPATLSCCGEQGLLSMAFDPNYESNGFFYVSYTAPHDSYLGGDCPGANNGGDNVVARFHVSGNPDVADETSKLELMRVDQPYANHNGGLIAFNEPPDNFLFMGIGDGGSGDDPCESGQNASQRLGKLLRLDLTDTPPITPDIWAIGLRNPWRWAFDRANGDLYIADVGQNQWEEVDYQAGPTVSGVDYQWDDMEGRHCHEPTVGCLTDGTQPVLEYDHSQGCSITGGYVYRGCGMPDLQGTYFYSDICSGFVRTFNGVSGGNAQNLHDYSGDMPAGLGGVSSFGQDARGELYIVDYGSGGADGEVYRIVPGP